MDKSLIGTNVAVQIALLVNNIEETAAKYARLLGLEMPNISVSEAYQIAKTEYKGEPCTARCKMAFLSLGGNLSLELIEPDEEKSLWRDMLDENGEGFHHLAFLIDGMETVVNTLAKEGMPVLQKGEWVGGRYAFIDAFKDHKILLELLETDK
jgi:4-hydroxyphenylpyruvate dioxygenase and related hemolysins